MVTKQFLVLNGLALCFVYLTKRLPLAYAKLKT